MEAFLLIDLSGGLAFDKPITRQVRQRFPAIPVFDVDASSEALLQNHAVRMLRQHPASLVCVQAGEGELSRLMPLLEELLIPEPQRKIVLLGEQPRLQRMLQARPGIAYTLLPDEEQFPLYLSGLV